MAKIKFTAGRIEDFQCEAGKRSDFLWDSVTPGLGLRVMASGAKSYIFQGKLQRQVIRITIGDPDVWPIEAPTDGKGRPTGKGARQEARRLKTLIDEGRDPRQVKADELAAEKAARAAKQAEETAANALEARRSTTFAQVWAVYIEERKPQWGERHYLDHLKKIGAGGVPSLRGTRGRGVTIAGPLHYFSDMPMSRAVSSTNCNTGLMNRVGLQL